MAKAKVMDDQSVEITQGEGEEIVHVDERVTLMEDLLRTEAWSVIKTYCEQEIKQLEDSILDTVSADFNKIEYTANDLNKIKRAFYKKLLETPETIIEFYGKQAIKDTKEDSM